MSGLLLGIGSVVIGGVSSGISFSQAAKQRRLQGQAEAEAEKMVRLARKKLDVNVYEELAIPKEAFELERESLLTQGATALQAGMEGEARGAAATAGRVQMAQGAAEAKVRAAMAKELADLNKLTAAEASRLRDLDVGLDLQVAQGAQLAARDAAEAKAAAMQQGMQSATSGLQGALSMMPLYMGKMGAQREALSGMEFTGDEYRRFGDVQGFDGSRSPSQGLSNLDFNKIGDMNYFQFRKFKRRLTPEQERMLFFNPQYTQNLQTVMGNDPYMDFYRSGLNNQ